MLRTGAYHSTSPGLGIRVLALCISARLRGECLDFFRHTQRHFGNFYLPRKLRKRLSRGNAASGSISGLLWTGKQAPADLLLHSVGAIAKQKLKKLGEARVWLASGGGTAESKSGSVVPASWLVAFWIEGGCPTNAPRFRRSPPLPDGVIGVNQAAWMDGGVNYPSIAEPGSSPAINTTLQTPNNN